MQSTIEHIENLVTKAGDIAETKTELFKLRASGKIAETVSSLISKIAIVMLVVAAITILSIGIAYWIGTEMGKVSYGFFLVGGFYILAGIIVHVFRKTLIKAPLSNLIIDKLIK
jgi:hypothetical protein